jgi:hypothetical protein
MIPDRNAAVIQDNVGGERVLMSIDPEAEEMVIKSLTDLYNDPEYAVVREYSTNAWDAHVEAGVTRPVEITLPTRWDPVLKIQDFGIGMTADDMRDTYSKYGTSTKRTTNSQTGMLGFGCKSALTYTQAFTVESVKDGLKVIVSVTRDEADRPTMTIVAGEDGGIPTDEPNGTLVTIPVKQYNHLDAQARRFFRFWPEGTVLVDGKAPERIEGLRVDEDLLLVTGEDQDYVVMGNVPYPCNLNLELKGYNAVVFVPIGMVHFTPSREALRQDMWTKSTLADVREFFEQRITDSVQHALDQCSTPIEALGVWNDWRRAMPNKPARWAWVTYQGHAMPRTMSQPKRVDNMGVAVDRRMVITNRYSGKLSQRDLKTTIDSVVVPGAVFVTGYPTTDLTPTTKKKLKLWADENNVDCDTFVLSDDPLDTYWIPADRTLTYEQVKAIKLPRTGRQYKGGRIRGSWDVWCDRGNGWVKHEGLPADDFPDGPLYYLTRYMFGSEYKAVKFVHQFVPDLVVVCVPDNRLNRFKRDFPDAQKLSVAVNEYWDKQVAKIKPLHFRAHVVQKSYDARYIRKLDIKQVKDPDFKQIHRLARMKYDKKPIDALYNQLQGLRYSVRVKAPEEHKRLKPVPDPADKYPLFDWSSLTEHPEDCYLYLNAAYAARKETV